MRRLLRQVLTYGSGRVALQLISLVTLPILTRVLVPSDYGVIETIAALMTVVGIASTLALDSGAQRSYYDYGAEQVIRRRRVLSTALWTMVLWSSVLTVVLVILARPLSEALFDSPRYDTVLRLAVVALPLAVASTFFLEIMRLRHQPGRYVALSISGAVVSVALVLFLVAVLKLGLEGFYLAGVLSALPTLLAAYWLVKGAVGLLFDLRELTRMLAYALPLLPAAATTWIMQFSDRFFVLRYASVEELGLYALGVRLSNVLLLAVTAFGIAWSPFIFELFSRDVEEERRVRARSLTYVALSLCFPAVCISVLAREFFVTVTPPAFEESYKVVGLLCGSVIAIGINGVTATGITLARRTRYFAIYAVYVAALNLALNVALIPPFGIVGAALATMLSYAALSVLYYRRAQRIDPVDFDLARLLKLLAITAALIAVGTYVHLETVWLTVVAKLLLILLFPVLAWFLGCLDPATVAAFRRALGLPPPAA